ncbi:MAG TPA: molybdopterin molybdotransferase MoeA [Chitinophagales bacterium]|nr:molybdopterin molybdotransferase MoeA [Chitinophagales bacterium]
MISIEEAQKLINAQARNFGVEEISIDNALNRILAEDIFADRDYPPFNRATMDGYAVVSSDFNKDKKTTLQLIGVLHAGNVSAQIVSPGTCIKIMTGAPVPEGADAVVRFEDTIENNALVEFTINTVLPKQNIASQGEDTKSNELLLEKNIKLNALSIAVLAVTGKAKIKVYKLPSVAIVSTGNEIVNVDDTIFPHQIRDSNSYSLKSFLRQYNVSSVKSVLVQDDKAALTQVLSDFMNTDILILSGGVSKGEADYIPEVLLSLGVEEIFHRVRIKPGNPLWFGRFSDGGVIFGLPGNPVSVQVGFKVFIEPFLRKCFNMETITPLYFPLFNEKIKKTKFTEYFPCKISTKADTTGLLSKRMNTSGDISATVHSDGIAVHPEETETIRENTIVEFYFW